MFLDMFDAIYSFIVGVIVGFIIGVIIVSWSTATIWEKDLVERGLAIYCPTDGKWAYVGECE